MSRSDLSSITVKDRYVYGNTVDGKPGSGSAPVTDLGSAAYSEVEDFATAAQGVKADNAVDGTRSGVATLLSGGTVDVAETSVGSGTLVFLSRQAITGSPGFLTWTVDPGVGFSIESSDAGDLSDVAWLLVG